MYVHVLVIVVIFRFCYFSSGNSAGEDIKHWVESIENEMQVLRDKADSEALVNHQSALRHPSVMDARFAKVTNKSPDDAEDKNLSDLHLSFLLFCVYLSPSKSNPFRSPTILCSFRRSFQRWVN